MGISAILDRKGHEVVSVGPDIGIGEVVSLLVERRIGAVPVIDGDSIVGMLSERDIVRQLLANREAVLRMVAKDVMTTVIQTIGPDDSIAEAMEMMTDRRIRHLPVVAAGRLLGIVSIGDLVKKRIQEAEEEAMQLKDYITTA